MAASRMKAGVTSSLSPNQNLSTPSRPRPSLATSRMRDSSRLSTTARIGYFLFHIGCSRASASTRTPRNRLCRAAGVAPWGVARSAAGGTSPPLPNHVTAVGLLCLLGRQVAHHAEAVARSFDVEFHARGALAVHHRHRQRLLELVIGGAHVGALAGELDLGLFQ